MVIKVSFITCLHPVLHTACHHIGGKNRPCVASTMDHWICTLCVRACTIIAFSDSCWRDESFGCGANMKKIFVPPEQTNGAETALTICQWCLLLAFPPMVGNGKANKRHNKQKAHAGVGLFGCVPPQCSKRQRAHADGGLFKPAHRCCMHDLMFHICNAACCVNGLTWRSTQRHLLKT